MVSSRKCWLRSLLTGLGILAAPLGASTVWAQSIDPFRPYQSQYDPYTYPTAPPDAGLPLQGVLRANQYQNYLSELQGTGRQNVERYGIGMPYYRSAIDPSFNPKSREYLPNAKTERSFEQTQTLITEKYFAYFSEKDPKKRAELLRDYNRARIRARAEFARAPSARRVNVDRVDPINREDQDSRIPAAPNRRTDTLRAPADTKARASSAGAPSSRPSTDRAGDRVSPSIPPAPPLFPGLGSRANRTRRSPSDILNRSLRMNMDDDTETPGSAPRAPSRSADGSNRRTPSSAPPSILPSDN